MPCTTKTHRAPQLRGQHASRLICPSPRTPCMFHNVQSAHRRNHFLTSYYGMEVEVPGSGGGDIDKKAWIQNRPSAISSLLTVPFNMCYWSQCACLLLFPCTRTAPNLSSCSKKTIGEVVHKARCVLERHDPGTCVGQRIPPHT